MTTDETGGGPDEVRPRNDTQSDPGGLDPDNRRPRRRGRRGRGVPPVTGPLPGRPPFRPPGQGFRPQGGQGFRPQGQGFRPQGGQGSRPQGGQGFRPQGQPFRGNPNASSGPAVPRPLREGEDEGSSQAAELAAYERRQAQQQQRRTGWRPAGAGPAAPWRGAGAPAAGGNRRYGGAGYTEQIRRVTAGPRVSAPSHEAGAGDPIAGPHAVLEALRAGRVIRKLYISQDRSLRTGPVNDLIAEAQEKRIFVNYVDKLEISRYSPIENHQGVVAIVEGRSGVELDELLLHLDTVQDAALVLVVDSLQDPQNFGVLLRSGEGAGVDGVIIPRHRSVGLTPAVAKTSAGASEHLLIADVANLRQAIDALKDKGLWVVGADDSGDLLYDEVDYRGPTGIVIGGEAEGIRRLVLEGCDQVVRIPMEGKVESLNAAAAGSVILYEALRQRRRDVAPPATQTPRPIRTSPPALVDLSPDDGADQDEDTDLDEDLEADLRAEDGTEREEDQAAPVPAGSALPADPIDAVEAGPDDGAAPKPARPRMSAGSKTVGAKKTTTAKKPLANRTKRAKPAE
ncbi:MAG TPA: 23S rRNA (guanosine(2251)-2'-O)-methyltransferase RlmB [Candidatus Saccharimonadales bacterium]|nr:23S rRNA (guanosine(2251)-2'-O)-methyltransferase RlmB [Candidatus Saccharimonadales bacterium]